MSDEFERIAAIRRRLARERPDVLVGIGDDAAVLSPSGLLQVCTVDVAVENVHFKPTFASWHDIGRRAFIAAVSDVGAMGARPHSALLSLVLPRTFEDDALFEIVDGVAEGADECRTSVVGGNLSRGSEVSITTTVLGESDGAPITRGGARPHDGIYVTGTIGTVALGLAILEAGRSDENPKLQYFADRWRRPMPRITQARRLPGIATAAVDVSDGLLQDLEHLCRASGVGAEIDLALLPTAPEQHEVAKTLGLDPDELALMGGEDYELLFTAPVTLSASELATRIGHVSSKPGVITLTDGPNIRPTPQPKGFRHF